MSEPASKRTAKVCLAAAFAASLVWIVRVLVSTAQPAPPPAPAVDVDLRALSPLLEGSETALYAATIADCSQLVSVSYAAGGGTRVIASSELQRLTSPAAGCQVDVSASGQSRFNPAVTLEFLSGARQTHTETFSVEK